MHVQHQTIQRIFKIRSELQEVYWNLMLQTFAQSLIGIFIPIYLLTLGFTLPHALTFALIYYVALPAFAPAAAWLASRVGYKHLILYRIPLFTVFYLLLILLQFAPSFGLLAVAALVGGASVALYWIPLNTEFARNIRKIHAGEDVAVSLALNKAVSIAAPTAAALLLVLFGFTTVFILVIVIMLVAIVPLFATNDYRGRFAFSRERRLFRARPRLNGMLVVSGIFMFGEIFLWPLFIFLSLGNIIDVGLAESISGIGVVLFTILVGKMTDHGRRGSIMRVGGVLYALVWVFRIFARTPLEFFALSLVGGMFAAMMEISFFSTFAEIARGRKVLDWIVVREGWLGMGRVGLILVMLLLPGLEISIAFIAAALAGASLLLVRRS